MAWQIEEAWVVAGAIEVDESYYSGRRKGNREGGTGGKVPVLGILQRGGKVSKQVISAATSQTHLPIIREKVVSDSIVYTDSYRSANALDISELKHSHSRMDPSTLFGGQTPPHHMASRTLGIRQNAIGGNTTEFPNNNSPVLEGR